jgi:polar amino acid transport system substrate-binding protein
MKKAFLFFILFVFLFNFNVKAQDLKVSLPNLPPLVENKEKGILVKLINEMQKEYKAGKIEIIGVYPFARSINNVVENIADFHMPILENPNTPKEKLAFMLSTETIFNVIFCLYTNKDNKEINPSNAFKFNIETMPAHREYFNNVNEVEIPNGLQKVNAGRIDGYICAMVEGDSALKQLNLTKIKRWEFKKFKVKIVLQKNKNGEKTDKILTDLIKKMKASGVYQKIMADILDQKFVDWQP